jgi:hypothetical protein
MADATFLSYVGAFTGVIGSVLGYVGYRQSREMKAVDLRIQIGHSENEVRISLGSLPGLMQAAKQSRTNVAAMSGQSGALRQWNDTFREDSELAATLVSLLPAEGSNYDGLAPAVLAARVVKLHELSLQTSQLVDRYTKSLAEDDRARDQRAADIRARGV